MTERSLFNVVCKIVGLWLFFEGASSLLWAFAASRFYDIGPFHPPESFSWFAGALYVVFGLLLAGRSSWFTRFMFRLDGPLDEQAPMEV